MTGRRALVALLALGAAAPAACFNTLSTSGGTPLRWSSGAFPIGYFINQQGSDDLLFPDVQAALQASFGTWQAVGSAWVSFTLLGVTAQDTLGNDGVNLIRWHETDFPFDRTSLAVTVNTFNDITGEMLDADMNFNGNFPWSVAGPGFDIQNVATHEAGHVLGLGHSPVPDATMFADAASGETLKRTLQQDDIAGVTFLYPVGAPTTTVRMGDVNNSGNVDGRDLVLLALAFGATVGSPRYLPGADFNDDGIVDGQDLAVVTQFFGHQL